MDEIIIIDQVEFQPDSEFLLKKMRIKGKTPWENDFLALLDSAQRIARPKAMAKIAFIDDRDEKSVVLNGEAFQSRILSVHFEEANRGFAFVATCGTELDGWAMSMEKPLEQYWAGEICETALNVGFDELKKELGERYNPGPLASLCPGSLDDWPIEEQKPLFRILGDVEKTVGVRLTEHCLMIPSKSISGIMFPTDSEFTSCALCPRLTCPNRKADYNPSIMTEKYA